MIISINGLLGSGKTLMMTILGHQASQKGRKIYSNYYTKFGELINPIDLLKFKLANCCVLIDEIQTFLDARTSLVDSNRLLTYFFLQSRKRDVDVIYTSQFFGAVDIRLRGLADYIIVAENYRTHFKYYVYNSAGILIKRIRLPYKKAIDFFNMYDTTQIITPLTLELERTIKFQEIMEIYEASPTKKSFISLTKKRSPFLPNDIIEAIYDLITNNKMDKAKELLKQI